MEILNVGTIWARVALVVFLIGVALYCAGYGTMYWMQNEAIDLEFVFSVGLWRAQNCSGGYGAACSGYYVPDMYKNGSFIATQVLTSITLVIFAVILVFLILYLVVESLREVVVVIGIALTCLFAVLLSIIIMIVWLAQIPQFYYVGYSFGLFVFGYILVLLAGLLLIPEIRTYGNSRGTIKVQPTPDEIVTRPSTLYDEKKRRYYTDYSKYYTNKDSRGSREIRNNARTVIRSPPPKYSGPPPMYSKPMYSKRLNKIVYPTPAWNTARF